MVFADLIKRGHKVALPYGEDWDYDLIVCRGSALERLQVKYTESNGEFVEVKCFSASLTNGRVRRVKRYTAQTVDWIGVYDRTTERCYYVPLDGARRRPLLPSPSARAVPERPGQGRSLGARLQSDLTPAAGLPFTPRGLSSVGRALGLQPGGRRFDPGRLHRHRRKPNPP